MTARPTFPWIGVAAPAVAGAAMWFIVESPFVLMGAVLGPVMVVAHFLDSVRRSKREAAEKQRRDAMNLRRAEMDRWSEIQTELAELSRIHPSVHQIGRNPSWRPPMDGRMDVRAGSVARDGVAGFPWLVSAVGGVAVVGVGMAAESVWTSLVVHVTACHGPPSDPGNFTWTGGVRLFRGESDAAEITIRCVGGRIESVTERGALPRTGEWVPDDMSQAKDVLARCDAGDGLVRWVDRTVCARGIGLSDGTPFMLDLSSEDPHVLVAGRTGTGKSEFLSALLCDWAERLTPAQLSWVGVDFKGGATLSPLSGLPNCAGVVTDLDTGMNPRALIGLSAEIERREVALRDENASRIEDSVALGRLAIVVDEFPELCRQYPEAIDVLAAIARRGRSLGMHLVLTTQTLSSLHRDGLAANIPVRVCLPMGAAHDLVSVIGDVPRCVPGVGRPIVVRGDGHQNLVSIRGGATVEVTNSQSGDGPQAPWTAPIYPPINGDIGFGLVDDPRVLWPQPALWRPEDGDVLVVGARRSGRTTALRQLVAGLDASWVTTIDELRTETGVVVVDDLDALIDAVPEAARHEVPTILASRRLERTPPVFVVSTTTWSPRQHGIVPNVLTLRTVSRDGHLATGEPLETFDPSAEPGVGSWRGRRVVIYARTESIVTDEIP